MESEESRRIQEKFILRALEKLGEGSQIVWMVLAVSVSVTIINGLHTMGYIFIAEVPNYWCAIPELTNANWTDVQIKNISIINGCQKYDYNYTYLASLGYEEATDYIKDNEFNTSVVSCSSFVFDKSGRSTIVNEWQLVCDRKVYRANTFLAHALGKLLGDFILGIYSDKYGRKPTLIIGVILQIIFVPIPVIFPWFWAYIISKFFVGASLSSMYSTGYTILSEVSKSHKKNLFGTIIDTMFPIGTLFLIIIAYFLSDWRHLQLAMSSFTLLLVIIIWFVPESPRWLISQNRHDEAKKVIEKYYKAINKPTLITESPTLSLRSENSALKTKKEKGLKRYFGKSKILFSDPVLRKKLLIMYFAFFVTLSVGYCLIFNIDLFETNRYIYSSIAASIELIALLSIPVILLKLSCQKASCIIYILASICMLSIIAVPKENINVIMGMTMVAKFCLITSFTVNMLLASELFPIAVRNTAIGTGLVMSQLGSMTAPYIIDFFSQVAWWAPTTLCGILSFIAGLLCLIIPT